MSDSAVQGKRVCKLMLVEVNSSADVAKGKAKQSNKFYNMYEQTDGTFIAEYGRVNSTCQKKVYPMSKWDSTIKSKTNPKKGYKDVTHLFAEEEESDKESTNAVIENRVVRRLMDELQAYASNSVKANYTVSSHSVTQAMVDEAQETLDKIVPLIQRGAIAEEINEHLLHLYHIIPRKMDNVQNFLLTSLASETDVEKAQGLIGEEQKTLDVMAGQVSINTQNKDKDDEPQKADILSILGLEMEAGTDADVEIVKKLMGPNANQFKACYKVVNKATQKRFDEHLEKAVDKKTELFWHGSRNQNWLNIISTGLMIRPAGAIHTGSMFGDGIYFADKAQKSIGYTSLRGSYWASGGDNKAYLALFSVHVGKQKHIMKHDRSCYNLSQQVMEREGTDSVFAHGGIDLRNNEYIIYDGAKCTISYLIEIGN